MQPTNIWLFVEATSGIVCACMANLTPVYNCLKHAIRSVTCSSNKKRRTPGRLEACREIDKSLLRSPKYLDPKLVLRPQQEDQVRLTTLAMTVIDRCSYENAEYGGGIRVRSELTQVVHNADQNSHTVERTNIE